MDSIVTRYQLPDSWSGKAACPVCRTSGSLYVVHEEILPDRMQCSACRVAFEMESGGAHVRLLALPEALAGRAPELLGAWLLPGEVPTIARPAAAALPEPFAPAVLPPVPTAAAAHVDAIDADIPPPAAGPLRRATGPLPARTGTTRPLKPPQTFGTAPLTAPAGAIRTTISLTPHAVARPTTPPPASAGPALDLHALNEELDGVLKTLPERPARSDEALADELARLMAELPVVAPEPAAFDPAPIVGEPRETISTQPVARDTFAAAVDPDGDPALDGQEPDTIAVEPEAALPVLDNARVAAFSEQGDKLRQFGNSIEVIRATIERSGASPDEARAALANIVAVDAARLRRFQRTLQWVGGAALLILLALVAVVLVISRPAPAPGPVGAAMPAAIQTLAFMLAR